MTVTCRPSIPGSLHFPPVTFERELYDRDYYEGLHPKRWFRNPPRKYAERNRDVLRSVDPCPTDLVVELGCAKGDVTFFLAQHAHHVIGVDAAPEALALAEAERARRGIGNVSWLEADVAQLSGIASRSVDAVAAIDLVEHIDDPTLRAMLAECRRILKPRGRVGIYTPDRAHWVERLKAHDFLLKQYPQHIAVRYAETYRGFLAEAGFVLALDAWSGSPFPFFRHVERLLERLPAVGRTFRYRIVLGAETPA